MNEKEYFIELSKYVRKEMSRQGLSIGELAETWAPTLDVSFDTARQLFSNAKNNSGLSLRQGDVKKKISVLLRALNTPAKRKGIVPLSEVFFGFKYNPNFEPVESDTQSYHLTEDEKEAMLSLGEAFLRQDHPLRYSQGNAVVVKSAVNKFRNGR
jgi:hypothetical protein